MADVGGTVLVNISDMIDLAIGTPEVGVVDFNMLQAVLHCLAQQMHILGKNVQLRGSVSALPTQRDNAQTIAITEFGVDTDQTSASAVQRSGIFSRFSGCPRWHKIKRDFAEVHYKTLKRRYLKPRTPSYKEAKAAAAADVTYSVLVVERVKKDAPPAGAQDQGSVPMGGTGGGGGAYKGAAGVIPRAGSGGQERLSLVTISKFNVLEDTVKDLKKRVYGSIPKNEEILEEVRSQTNLKSITDMWTNLNVSSRLEAAEHGIAKLSSLVEDLIGETIDLQRRASQEPESGRASRPGSGAKSSGASAEGKSTTGGGARSTTGGGARSTTGGGARSTAGGGARAAKPGGRETTPALMIEAGPDGLTLDDLQGMQDYVNAIRVDLDDLADTVNRTMLDEGMDRNELFRGDEDGQAGTEPGDSEVGERKVDRLGAAPTDRRPSEASSGVRLDDAAKVQRRLGDVEKRLKECCDDSNRHIAKLTDHVRNLTLKHAIAKVSSIDDQVQYLMKQVAGVSSDLTDGKLSPDLIKDLKGLMELFSTVQAMQEQLQQVHDTALKLSGEKEDRQHHINALLEQIELLKAIKMDREDMAEAMAEKADLRALARKVSHDQFEMACDDLSRGLENAIGKLNMQEALWQQALDDIQREIETKLDKMELSPVKDFFNNKLKQLQENLRQMASLRREVEAAGTKRRLLRDVNCISCDANAVMQTETAAALPLSKPLPQTISMKPYLSYELDAIRKAQASNVPQRNLHDWENIDKQMTQPGKPLQKVRSETDKHICNRYCGGSHTVTTPAQRVARLGHFVKQWGPDVLPLSSGLAAGDDGRMYKVTTAENAIVGPGGAVDATCTPRTPTKKDAKTVQKSITISAECRCLEGDFQKE